MGLISDGWAWVGTAAQAHIVMAYIVMAYIVMAQGLGLGQYRCKCLYTCLISGHMLTHMPIHMHIRVALAFCETGGFSPITGP